MDHCKLQDLLYKRVVKELSGELTQLLIDSKSTESYNELEVKVSEFLEKFARNLSEALTEDSDN